MSQQTFITDSYLPTLESVNCNAAKKLKDMCKDMEGLMDNTNQKITNLLQNQSNSFFKAFKVVVEQMSTDFKNLQQKFEQYVAFHENETEVVNVQNKLAFFRNECSLLHKINGQLKDENSQLREQVQQLEDEVQYHKKILLNKMKKEFAFTDQMGELKKKIHILSQQNKLTSNSIKTDVHSKQSYFETTKLKVPKLKIQRRLNTDGTQDYDYQSMSTFSNKNQITQISKEKLYRKHMKTLNKTSDEIMDTDTMKSKKFDQFYENSYKNRTKSQQQTIKKVDQIDLNVKTPDMQISLVKNIKTNPQYSS